MRALQHKGLGKRNVNDIKRAIADISDIRSQLAASTRFRGYAPEVVATTGLVSLLVIIAQLVWPGILASSDAQIALIWGGVLVINGLTVGVETIARARAQHRGMAGAMLRGASIIAVPVTFTGAVLGGVVLLKVPEVAWLLPGTWQMIVSLVAFSSHSILPRKIVWPAGWYLLSGAFVLIVSAWAGHVSPIMAGGPFVIGHLWIARILRNEGVQA